MDDHFDDVARAADSEQRVGELDPWNESTPEPPPFSDDPDADPPFTDWDPRDQVWVEAPRPAAGRGAYPADRIGEPVPPRRLWPVVVIAFAAAVLGAFTAVAVLALTGIFEGDDSAGDPTPPVTVIERIRTEIVPPEDSVGTAQAVWEKVAPSVATVVVGTRVDDICQQFGSGSGVVLDESGRVATNHHVVDGSECQQVVFDNGVTYDARLLGSDELTDLAVLDIDADELTPIEIGGTADLSIGETTIAVGNPLGQVGGSSLTVGVLSAINREVDFGDGSMLFGMLQTDAPITQGSSGGALVDAVGRLIGITSAIGVSEAGAEGIGYAIPVELVQRITSEIIEAGTVHHAFLGIEGGDHVVERADGATAPAGAEIRTVLDATSASQLGLQVGDVIIGLDGATVTTMNDLVIALRLYRVGDEVTVLVDRNGSQLERVVVLGERPEDAGG